MSTNRETSCIYTPNTKVNTSLHTTWPESWTDIWYTCECWPFQSCCHILLYGISSTHTNWYIVQPEIAETSQDISLHTCIFVLALVMDFFAMLLIVSIIFIFLADQCSSFLLPMMQINLFFFNKVLLILTWPLPDIPAILYVRCNSGFHGSSYENRVR